jgi:hypothetical protein
MSGLGKVHIYENSAVAIGALLYNFDVNVKHPKAEHIAWIAQNVIHFAKKDNFVIQTIGLASRTGSDNLNMALAKARGEAVYNIAYLYGLGKLRNINDVYFGERAAALLGVKDDVEDDRWRSVFLTILEEKKYVHVPVPRTFVERRLSVVIVAKEEHKTFSGGEPGEKAYQGAQTIRRSMGWANNVVAEEKGLVDSRFDLLRITLERSSSSDGIPFVSTYEVDYVKVTYQWGPGKHGNDFWPEVKLIKLGTPGHARDQTVVRKIGILEGQEWLQKPTMKYANR